jgi:fucose permease
VHTADIALTTIPVEASEVVTGRAIMSVRTRMARALGMRAVWTGFVLIIVAFGSLDTLSAWMVTYMVEKRGAPSAASRYQLSGLWGGIALGRVVLAYVGRRMGERTFALMLLSSAIGFLGVVWGVQNSTVDACAIVLVGFFIG